MPSLVVATICLWALYSGGAQLLYVPIELIGASLSTAQYSLLHNTISDLGATTCTTIPYPSQGVLVCSPAHILINGSTVLFGLAMTVGAFLLRPWLPRGATMTTAVVLWSIVGVSSVGAGLTPLDQMINLHALVATPGIVLSGVAMVLTGIALARTWRSPVWWWLVAAGAISTAAGTLLLVRLEVQWGGLIERVALWPSFAACALVAFAVLRQPVR